MTNTTIIKTKTKTTTTRDSTGAEEEEVHPNNNNNTIIYDHQDNNEEITSKNVLLTTTTTEEEEGRLLLERKIAIATEGLVNYVIKKLKSIKLKENIETLCDYVIAMNAEINPNIMYKKNQILIICFLSEFHNNSKLFSEMTRNDVLGYLDSLRKPEASDPYHGWIGTV